MGCACRKNVVGNPNGATGSITGYRYTPPATSSEEPQTFMTVIEARAAQRRNGGGTIKVQRAA